MQFHDRTVDFIFAYHFVENDIAREAQKECGRPYDKKIFDVESLFTFAEEHDIDVVLLQTLGAHFQGRENPQTIANLQESAAWVGQRAAAWQWQWPQERGDFASRNGAPQRLALLVDALPQHFCWGVDGGYSDVKDLQCLDKEWQNTCGPLLDADLGGWRNEVVAAVANASAIGHLRLFDAFAGLYGAHVGSGQPAVGAGSNADCTHWVFSAGLFQPFFSRLYAHLAHRFGDPAVSRS